MDDYVFAALVVGCVLSLAASATALGVPSTAPSTATRTTPVTREASVPVATATFERNMLATGRG